VSVPARAAPGQPKTLQRVRTHWLPELRRLNVRVPIILVGCKNDIKPAEERAALQDVRPTPARPPRALTAGPRIPQGAPAACAEAARAPASRSRACRDPRHRAPRRRARAPARRARAQAVVPVMRDCKEIETCLECSAEKLVFVGEVFYYALKAVVHPTGPLFDATAQGGQGALTPLCVKALKRIFLMCDTDQARPARPARPPRPLAGTRVRRRRSAGGAARRSRCRARSRSTGTERAARAAAADVSASPGRCRRPLRAARCGRRATDAPHSAPRTPARPCNEPPSAGVRARARRTAR